MPPWSHLRMNQALKHSSDSVVGARVDGEHTEVVLVTGDPVAGELRRIAVGHRAVNAGLGRVTQTSTVSGGG
jgi:hypothetical protein